MTLVYVDFRGLSYMQKGGWTWITDAFCSRYISERFDSKLHHSVFCPSVLYGFAFRPTTKDNRFALCWNSDVIRYDHLRNEDISDWHGVATIVEKLWNSYLRGLNSPKAHSIMNELLEICSRIGDNLDVGCLDGIAYKVLKFEVKSRPVWWIFPMPWER